MRTPVLENVCDLKCFVQLNLKLHFCRFSNHFHFNTFSWPVCLQVFCEHEDLHGDDLHDYGGLEFPQINYGRCNTKPYRYFYGCGFRHMVGDSLLKVDLQDKSLKVCACVVWVIPRRIVMCEICL